MPIRLTPRPYQVKLIERCRAEYGRGVRSVLAVLPTGGGKTLVASFIVDGAIKKAKRVLWLAGRRELIKQAALAMPETPGIIMAGKSSDYRARIQVASIDTLATNLRDFPDADLVIYDEAHHVSTRTSLDILGRYPSAWLLGITATPSRGDGSALGDVFKSMVLGPSIASLIDLGFLVLPDVIGPPSDGKKLASDPVDAWIKYAEERPGFVFAKTRDQSKEIVTNLILNGIRAAHIEANTPKKERDETIEKFRRGRIDVLSSVNVFTEGVDLPRAAVCLLARGCQHMGTYLQMVGRVLRPYPGKKSALIIDLLGQAWLHGLPDSDRIWSLDGKPISLRDRGAAIRQCPACGLCFTPGPDHCRRCGFEFPAPEQPKVEPRPMENLRDRLRPRLQVNEEEMRAKFEELVRTARGKGYKASWVGMKFQGIFGHWPKWKIEVDPPSFEELSIPSNPPRGWWKSILDDAVTLDEAKRVYREKAKKAHPDVGGSKEKMQELVVAIQQAKKELIS